MRRTAHSQRQIDKMGVGDWVVGVGKREKDERCGRARGPAPTIKKTGCVEASRSDRTTVHSVNRMVSVYPIPHENRR